MLTVELQIFCWIVYFEIFHSIYLFSAAFEIGLAGD